MLGRYLCPTDTFRRAGQPRRGGAAGPGALLSRLDTGDVLLLLVLFFLYTESHDEDFLIILAVMAMHIFKG